jgi:hypothetical protein
MSVGNACWYAIAGRHGTKAANRPASRSRFVMRNTGGSGSVVVMWDVQPGS